MRVAPGTLLQAAAAVALLLLSGCTSGPPDAQIKDVLAVPSDAPHEVGSGSERLVVHILAEAGNGSAVPGAALLVHVIPKPLSPPSVAQLRSRNASFAARSDDQGAVVVHVEPGATYSFLVSAPGFTLESRHLVKMTPETLANPLLIPLFRSEITLHLQGRIPAATVKYSKSPICCINGVAAFWGQNVTFHPSPASQRQYVFRLGDVDAKLNWNNTAVDYADLGVRQGFWPATWWETDKTTETPAQGNNVETHHLSHEEAASGSLKKDAKYGVGPMTRSSIVGPNGIPWSIELRASFTTDGVEMKKCPYYYPNTCLSETPGFASTASLVAALAGLGLAGLATNRPPKGK